MYYKKYVLIDVGNSFTEVALLSFSSLERKSWHFSSFKRYPTADLASFFSEFSPHFPCIVSSVVPNVDTSLKSHFKSLKFVTYKTVLPFMRLDIESPKQVGADRIVNAMAATQLYGKPTLIIDSGTATTWCFVDKNGIYQGGNIFPGLGISSKSLQDYTAKLPLVSVKSTRSVFGKNTKQAIQSGLYWGFIHLINGVIAQYRDLYPDIVCVGTGQGLSTLKSNLNLDVWDNKLIFKGLAFLINS